LGRTCTGWIAPALPGALIQLTLSRRQFHFQLVDLFKPILKRRLQFVSHLSTHAFNLARENESRIYDQPSPIAPNQHRSSFTLLVSNNVKSNL
jgi:hypothetical protein